MIDETYMVNFAIFSERKIMSTIYKRKKHYNITEKKLVLYATIMYIEKHTNKPLSNLSVNFDLTISFTINKKMHNTLLQYKYCLQNICSKMMFVTM